MDAPGHANSAATRTPSAIRIVPGTTIATSDTTTNAGGTRRSIPRLDVGCGLIRVAVAHAAHAEHRGENIRSYTRLAQHFLGVGT